MISQFCSRHITAAIGFYRKYSQEIWGLAGLYFGVGLIFASLHADIYWLRLAGALIICAPVAAMVWDVFVTVVNNSGNDDDC